MASDDVPYLSRQTVNPALGLDNLRLTSLLFQVIGVSGVEFIGLPSDPPLSHFRRTRQLLLRVQWILEALQANSVNITTSTSSPSLNGPTSLRILLLLMKVCSSNELNAGSEADYNLWRHITLNTIISATRTFLLSNHDTSLEEEDLVLTGLQNLCDIWRENQELSAVEKVLLHDILPHSISAQNEILPRKTSSGLGAEVENLIAAVSGTPSEAKEHFWALNDITSEIMWCLSGFINIDSETTFDSSSAHEIIGMACERSREKGVYRSSAAIIQFQMERLASVLRVLQGPRQWHEDESLLDRQLAMRMSRIVKIEKEEFGRSFLTSHISQIQHSPPVSPITPTEMKFGQIDDPRSAARTATLPVEWPSEESWRSLPASTVLPLVSPQLESNLVLDESDQNYTETILGSDSVDLEFASAKVSASGFDLIPIPSASHRKSTSAALIPTSTEDSASLYLPEPISSLDYNTEPFDLDLDIRPRSEASSNEKPSGWTKGRVAKLIKSVTKSTTESLPSSLDFCFSGPGDRIALWCKEVADSVILINPQSYSGQRYALTMPTLPTHKRFSKKIRHVSSSGNVIIAIVHIENSRWLYQSTGNTLRPTLLLDEKMPSVSILSLSPDGLNIALGCGKCIYVYTRLNDELRGPRKLPLLNNTETQAVRAHKLNFSIDSTKLISCIQVKNKSPQNALYVSIWTCDDSGFELDSQLSPILLSQAVLGYSDETGISSVFLAGEPEPRSTQHVFLTAALSKPYPSVIPLTSGAKYKALDLQNKRIDSSAQCLVPSSSHFFAVKSGYHEIYRVDVRSAASELVANFSKERKYIQDHHIALSMGDADTVYSLWRTRDEGLVLKTSVLGGGKWTTSSVDVGPVYRQLAEIL